MEEADLVGAVEKETKFKTGKLGSEVLRHLIKKRTSKSSRKYIRGSSLSERSRER